MLNDGTIVKRSCVHKRDTKTFKIQDIDLDKIKTSKKKLYSKASKAYKHYLLQEHNNGNVSLLIKLPEMIGRYKIFNNNKKVNFYVRGEELLKKYEEMFKSISK